MNTDVKLVKLVHKEACGAFKINAIISRFGDLSVIAHDENYEFVWQGDNIIEARKWCLTQPIRVKAQNLRNLSAYCSEPAKG